MAMRTALVTAIAGFCLVHAIASAGELPQRVLRAGAYAIDISPKQLPVLVNGGFTERLADKVVDPLHARCLVLDDGSGPIAIAVVDSCVIPLELQEEAKRLAHEKTGIPVERMLISATHSHSCPAVMSVLGTPRDEPYSAWLPGKIAEGIAAAKARLAPARIGWAVGKDPKNVFCRRFRMKPGTAATNPFSGTANDQAQMNPGHQNPNAIERTGPADTDVSVVSVQTADGKPLAVLGNYSTHYAGAPAISADYFGVFARRIKELVGGGDEFVGIMSNGTSGDANCLDFVNPPRQFDYLSVGEDTAQAAYQAYQTIKYYDWAPVVMAETRLALGVRKPKPEEVAAAKEFLAGLAGRKPQSIPEVYALETLYMDEMPSIRELKLQAIRLGELGIVAMPCEVYGSTGLAIKARSPLKPTFSIELANGYDGYLPPPEQHALGGYTTWRARSSCLEVEAEPKILAAVLTLLEEVASDRRDEALIATGH